MIPVSRHWIETRANLLYSSAGCKAPPVDLHALARYRRVTFTSARSFRSNGDSRSFCRGRRSRS